MVVLGGGDTAMDCVRTALRHGAANVTCAYRRDEGQLYAGVEKEGGLAREEGRELWLTFSRLSWCGYARARQRYSLLRTRLGEPDVVERGGTAPGTPVPGGEVRDAGGCGHYGVWFSSAWYVVAGIAWREKVDNWGRIAASVEAVSFTRRPTEIFAGGDAVRGADLVVTAMAEDRHAAQGDTRLVS